MSDEFDKEYKNLTRGYRSRIAELEQQIYKLETDPMVRIAEILEKIYNKI